MLISVDLLRIWSQRLLPNLVAIGLRVIYEAFILMSVRSGSLVCVHGLNHFNEGALHDDQLDLLILGFA